MKTLPYRGRRQRGLTLMEVLVSMLVMALGMLGIAALQTTTMKYQLGTTERSAITVLLADYAERVRINLGQAPGMQSSGTSPYLLAGTWESLAGDIPAAANCATGECSAAEMGGYDMAMWRQAVRAKLPTGSAVVSGNAQAGMTVTFMWQDKEFNRNSNGVLGIRTSATCPDTPGTGIDQQACCPEGVAAPAGVRCANFVVTP